MPTLESKSLSHMSLMVQPALRIKNEPRPNKAKVFRSGSCPAAPERLMLQVHGRNNNHVPMVHAIDKHRFHKVEQSIKQIIILHYEKLLKLINKHMWILLIC